MKSLMKLSVAIIVIFTLGGCTVIPHASPEEKQKAINVSVKPEKSAVYIIRNEKGSYQIHEIDVLVSGQVLKTYGQSFSMHQVPPVVGKIETDIAEIIGSDAELPVDLKAGKKYYFHVSKHYRPLIGPRAEIVELSELEAKALLQKLPLLKVPNE